MLGQLLHKGAGQLGICMGPDIDDLIVSLGIGDEPHIVVGQHFFNLFVGSTDHLFLHLRNDNIIQVERQSSADAMPNPCF